ncbi:MAG: N-acyl-D-glutamate deacylase [candidate division BRC1 bacterium ADurb.BinA364]|nr:MAG: N-acyl-D-glutamate deacylase [candidate division BRC1 bacterium ADurb.BinA364]
MTIARESSARSEIYHLKASGPSNWRLLDPAIERIERARAKGMPVGADVYPYHASGTGMTSLFPLWALEGGFAETVKRFGDPEMRRTIRRQILGDDPQFACLLRHAEGAERVMPVGFKSQALKPLAGRTLDSIARERGTDALDAAMDLIVEDGSRIESVFFTMSEENVRKKVALPWTSICSDAGSMAPEGVFLKRMVHPRTYGAFARVLGKYVREERALSLELAVRKMSGLPAETLGLKDRGRVAEGCFADLAVFDPMAIADRATFAQPHRYSVGMRHVFVNGVQVLADGEHTGARPGKAVRGPGYKA